MQIYENTDLEKSVLGCLISFEDVRDSITNLNEDDFNNQSNKLIFKALETLYLNNSPIDIVTVSDELIDKMHASTNFASYLTSLKNYEPSAAHHIYNIKTLKTYTLRRNLLKMGNELVNKAGSIENEPESIYADTTRKLLDMDINTNNIDTSLQRVLTDTYTVINEAVLGKNIGTKIGLTDFDNLTGGIFKGELTVIGARPGVGKSALGMHIALSFAKQKKAVEFVSLEMSREQYGIRLIALESGVSSEKMRRGNISKEETSDIIKSLPRLSDKKIFINTAAKTPAQILSACRQRKQSDGLDLLVVDYLQLIRSDRRLENRVQEVSEISKALKEITLDLGIPVIAMSQLNRNAARSVPTMADLRESGAIEQDADNIILLHDTEEKVTDGKKNMKLIVAKQRQGSTGYIDVVFEPAKVKFSSLYRGN